MICVNNLHLKRFLLTAVFAVVLGLSPAFAAVETYVDDAVPPDPNAGIGQPLSPGQLTMQDVLAAAGANKKKPALKPPAPAATNVAPLALVAPTQAPSAPAAKATVPVAATTSTNTPGSMLMQGMENVLGTSAPTAAHAPIAATETAPVKATDVAKGVSVAPLPDVGKTTMANCTVQTSSWVKSCAEAGYPENYTGQIKGETRTTCPAGNLQDVWVANSCSPPDGEAPAATAPLTSPTVATNPGEPVDASCGASNGLATNERPIDDLCAAGTSTPVAGAGPWRWNCQGSGGGTTVSCAAPVSANGSSPKAASAAATAQANTPVVKDAFCGAANGQTVDAAPTTGLCAEGAASRVNGNGPWTWACSGTNGGRAAACSANKKIDGACGAANGSGSDQMPMASLCDAGYASAVTGNGPWAWTCSGLNGGIAATCSAEPRMNAVCGPASLNGHNGAPKNALCSVGQASAISGSGPWSWTCGGQNGGASVTCEARVSENGSCGLAHGTSVPQAPVDNLCATGKPTRVTGNGPWSWACSGTDGGDTASCTATRSSEHVPVPVPPAPTPKPKAESPDTAPAPLAAPVSAVDSTNMCGAATEFVAIEAPSKDLCKTGTASSVNGNGPWNWTCSDNGVESSCSTLSLDATSAPTPAATPHAATTASPEQKTAACGISSGQSLTQEPASDLCTSGKASSVSGSGPWSWTCTKGKSHAACSAEKTTDGTCGLSNGELLKAAPSSGLCASGTATQVQGTGPWMWTCVGTGGGASTSCSAASQAQTRVDGNCGLSANAQLASMPASNLCDSGTASSVYGEGPWTWTCSGMNGGTAASCSAQKNTPPAPPPPGPAENGLCGNANGVAMLIQPMDNLCSGGTATAVSGNGPWNWNCIGQNGGMTVSCTAPLQPPAPISGACGQANGVPTLTTPRSGLCSAGISSAVSGKGPWTWSCSGVNGGSAVGCVAPLAGASVGSLPSMTTQSSSAEAPPPSTAPVASVAKKGLVTPRLPSGTLPSYSTGSMPAAAPAIDSTVPDEAPQLPDDTQGVTPPPVRDMIQPAPALRTDDTGAILPGNHFVLDAAVSTIPFAADSDNFDSNGAHTLDLLATILQKNGGVRITLTAYAGNSINVTPREARRLSLSRALAVRDYLTSKAVSSGRIDVRALGANVTSGDPDRVDIKAN